MSWEVFFLLQFSGRMCVEVVFLSYLYLVDFTSDIFWDWDFLEGIFFLNKKFIFLMVIQLFRLFLFWALVVCVFQGIGSFPLSCQIYLHGIIHNIPWLSLKCQSNLQCRFLSYSCYWSFVLSLSLPLSFFSFFCSVWLKVYQYYWFHTEFDFIDFSFSI